MESQTVIPAGFLRLLFLSAWKRGLVGWIGFHRVKWAGEESADFSGWRSWVDMFGHIYVGNDTLKTPFLMPFIHWRRDQRKRCFEFFQLLHFFGGAAESTRGMVGNQIFSPRGPKKEGSGESWDRRWYFSRFLTHHRIPLEAAASKVLKQFATYTVHLKKLFLDWSDHESLLGKFTNSESQAVSWKMLIQSSVTLRSHVVTWGWKFKSRPSCSGQSSDWSFCFGLSPYYAWYWVYIEYILPDLKNSHNLMVESYVLFRGNF